MEQIANLAMVIQIVDCVLIWISMILYMRNVSIYNCYFLKLHITEIISISQ